MKKTAAILLAIVLLVALTVPAFADPPMVNSKVYSKVPTEGTPASDAAGSAKSHKLYAQKDIPVIYITNWSCQIREISNAYLRCNAFSFCSTVADGIDHNFVIQQWNGYNWVGYANGYTTEYNTQYSDTTIYRYVAHDHYYRLHTTHYAWLGMAYDQVALTSTYIYVP